MDWSFWNQPFLGMTVGAYLKFILILVVAIVLKRYVSLLLSRLLYRLFRRARNQTYVAKFNKLVLPPFDGLIVTISFFIAAVQLGPILDDLIILRLPRANAQAAAPVFTAQQLVYHLFFFALIFFITRLVTGLITFLFFLWQEDAREENDKPRMQLLPLLKDILNVLIWALAVFTVLGVVFHVNIAALVTGLGIGGIVVAFAAKDSIENLLASFMVLVDKPFTIGDWIKIKGVEGNVERIGFRSTRIRSFDRSLIILPNRTLITEELENFSERGSRRILFTIRAHYGLDEATLQQITTEISRFIKSRPGVTGDPIVSLESFGETAVNIQVIYYVFTRDVDYTALVQEINYGIYRIMNEHGRGFALPAQVSIMEPPLDGSGGPERSIPDAGGEGGAPAPGT